MKFVEIGGCANHNYEKTSISVFIFFGFIMAVFYLGDLSPEVAIVIGSTQYRGWTDVSITRQIDSTNQQWSVSGTTRSGFSFPTLQFKKFVQCKILSYGKLVITGQIMTVNIDRDRSTGTVVSISGDSKAINAVQSVYNGDVQLNKLSATKMIKRILKPFGLNLVDEIGDESIIDRYIYREGMPAMAACSEIARKVGGTLRLDSESNVVLTKYRNQKLNGSLIQGLNIKRYGLSQDGNNQFSEYATKGSKTPDDAANRGKVVNQISSVVNDKSIDIYRPTVFNLGGDIDSKQAKIHADIEMTRRAGLSDKVLATGAGWENRQGDLWEENKLVFTRINDNTMPVDGFLLVESVNMTKSRSNGAETSMSLVNRDSYQAEIKTQKPRTGLTSKKGGSKKLPPAISANSQYLVNPSKKWLQIGE